MDFAFALSERRHRTTLPQGATPNVALPWAGGFKPFRLLLLCSLVKRMVGGVQAKRVCLCEIIRLNTSIRMGYVFSTTSM